MTSFAEIDIETARRKLDEGCVVFVDVRDRRSYEQARIPGALHLTDANVQQFVADTDKAATVIVYCYHGNSSRGGAAYLVQQGFRDVHSMRGGFEAWRGRHPETHGHPETKGS